MGGMAVHLLLLTAACLAGMFLLFFGSVASIPLGQALSSIASSSSMPSISCHIFPTLYCVRQFSMCVTLGIYLDTALFLHLSPLLSISLSCVQHAFIYGMKNSLHIAARSPQFSYTLHSLYPLPSFSVLVPFFSLS